jgi:hypothetical protein
VLNSTARAAARRSRGQGHPPLSADLIIAQAVEPRWLKIQEEINANAHHLVNQGVIVSRKV